jgi:CheY-like chemotaxis protein
MKRILLIEDDFDLARSIVAGIELIGLPHLQIEIKLDGASAQARIKIPPAPDLVILDMHLPHVAGQDIYESIRGELPNCKVIIITADVALAHEIREQSGDWQALPMPDDVFTKPFSLLEFQRSVREILSEVSV